MGEPYAICPPEFFIVTRYLCDVVQSLNVNVLNRRFLRHLLFLSLLLGKIFFPYLRTPSLLGEILK